MTCLVCGNSRILSHQQLGIHDSPLGGYLHEVGSTVNMKEWVNSLSDLLEITASVCYRTIRTYHLER